MQLRWILTAAAATLALAGCSDGKDTAKADPTPSPTTVATSETPSPTPSPTPTTTTPPAPDPVAFDLTGRSLGDRRVVAVKAFWTGATASAVKGSVVPEVRVVSTRPAQRALAAEVDNASKKGWVLPPRPIGVVTGVSGNQTTGAVRICLWSPSVSWINKKSGKYVESVRKRWLEYEFDVRGGRVDSYKWISTCRRAAP